MATGLLVNNICYETAAQAADAYFSSLPVVSFQDPLNLLVHQSVKFEFVAPNWLRSVYGEVPWGSSLWSQTLAVPPAFPPCLAPSESFNLGLQFGAAFVGTLIIAWGFLMAKKVLF